MSDLRRELEQFHECRGVGVQLEQQPDEFEQQCGWAPRLRIHLTALTGAVELQGYIVPRTANWECPLLFGRATEHQQGENMKRVGGLFDSVFTRENLYQAYLDARKGKRKKGACHRFEINLGANLDSLHQEIHAGSYRPRPYHKFLVHEPKERVIHAPAFRDIVAQHAIYRVIYEIYNRTFIATSFACRKGFGTHKASDYTQHVLGRYDDCRYTLKLDIRKFFYSIDRDILRTLLGRKIKDKRLLDIMMLFAHQDESTGIPIGNLLSQLYALIYLNPLDQFVKRVLGVRHYVRYVDDFILFGLTLDQCREYRERIVAFLASGLRLRLSKSTIQKVRRGVNFVGYRTWKGCRLIRKHSLHRFRRSLKRGKWESVISLIGHASRTRSLGHMTKTLSEAVHASNPQIPKNFRRLHHLAAAR